MAISHTYYINITQFVFVISWISEKQKSTKLFEIWHRNVLLVCSDIIGFRLEFVQPLLKYSKTVRASKPDGLLNEDLNLPPHYSHPTWTFIYFKVTHITNKATVIIFLFEYTHIFFCYIYSTVFCVFLLSICQPAHKDVLT